MALFGGIDMWLALVMDGESGVICVGDAGTLCSCVTASDIVGISSERLGWYNSSGESVYSSTKRGAMLGLLFGGI